MCTDVIDAVLWGPGAVVGGVVVEAAVVVLRPGQVSRVRVKAAVDRKVVGGWVLGFEMGQCGKGAAHAGAGRGGSALSSFIVAFFPNAILQSEQGGRGGLGMPSAILVLPMHTWYSPCMLGTPHACLVLLHTLVTSYHVPA